MMPPMVPARSLWKSATAGALLLASFLGFAAACAADGAGTPAGSEPWTAANTVAPADLVRELAGTAGASKPVVAFTGPAFLYKSGHVPGSVQLPATSSPEGVATLKAWAQRLPKTSSIVVYCGCCPLDVCPNLRPSFVALRDMGFARVRVLILPNSFGRDWAGQGFPVER